MLDDRLRHRIYALARRLEEIDRQLSDSSSLADICFYTALLQERNELQPVVETLRSYESSEADLEAARELSLDPETADFAHDEMAQARERIDAYERSLLILLLPKAPNDEKSVFLELRAGTGGNESALFVGDLLRMYLRYAESRGWTYEIVSSNPSEHGGYREAIARIVGQGVYERLKFESGVHRVQRVPATESIGRIHTSAATVAVMPEPDEPDDVELNPADLRIDVFRASGAGGQHIQKTDSAVRITHLPTGLSVECQDERSQAQNKARAMAVLAARIRAAHLAEQQAREASERRELVGSGDRSERIRTYNFPQGRVTDHRLNLSLYKLSDILDGNLDELIEPLLMEHQMRELAALGA